MQSVQTKMLSSGTLMNQQRVPWQGMKKIFKPVDLYRSFGFGGGGDLLCYLFVWFFSCEQWRIWRQEDDKIIH